MAEQKELPLFAPKIDVEGGIGKWQGNLLPPAGGVKMKNGDISNLPNPYVAFDFECFWYVPEQFQKKVALLERFPIGYLNRKSSRYYKKIPGAQNRLADLMRFAYNVEILYSGPRHLWAHRMTLMEPFPFTKFVAVDNAEDLEREVIDDPQLTVLYSMSAIKVQHSKGKGVLFNDWGSLGLEKR